MDNFKVIYKILKVLEVFIMMFKPSKKVLELWEKYNEAYDAGDLEEYERLHAEYMKLYTKESDEFRSKMPSSFC